MDGYLGEQEEGAGSWIGGNGRMAKKAGIDRKRMAKWTRTPGPPPSPQPISTTHQIQSHEIPWGEGISCFWRIQPEGWKGVGEGGRDLLAFFSSSSSSSFYQFVLLDVSL